MQVETKKFWIEVAALPEKKFEEGHCPKCGSGRADAVAEHKVEHHEPDFDSETYYRVLECRGCGQPYFKSSSTNSEDFRHYFDPDQGEEVQEYIETINYWPPSAKRRSPDWVSDIGFEDRVLGSLFNDVYTALSNNLGVLSAIGMRTVFDRASELLGIDPETTFKQKLKELKALGHITEKELKALNALIDAGSAAAHRGWKPKPNQLDNMLTILEAFLHRAFLLEEIGTELDQDIPKRRLGKAKKKNE
jgi:hypothetical protein